MENYKWKSQVEGIAAVGQTSQRNSHAKKVSTPGKKDCKTGNGELKLSLKTATTKKPASTAPSTSKRRLDRETAKVCSDTPEQVTRTQRAMAGATAEAERVADNACGATCVWSPCCSTECFIKKGELLFLICGEIKGGVALSLKPVGVVKLIRLG